MRKGQEREYVDVLDAPTGRRRQIGRLGKPDRALAFALARDRVLVVDQDDLGHSFTVLSASARKRGLRAVGGASFFDFAIPPVAADGPTLVHFTSSIEASHAWDGIMRVSGTHSSRLVSSGFPLGLAVAGGRFAIAEGTTSRVERQEPAWSPDGGRIAFARTQLTWYGRVVPAGTGLYVLEVATGRETRISAHRARSIDWSSEGRLVFEAPPHSVRGDTIYVADEDGSSVRAVASGLAPRWSPDGGRIAFASRDESIQVMNADGSEVRAVATGSEATRSPNGEQLAIAADDGITLADHDGSSAHRLGAVSGSVSDLDWSPDGSRLLFTRPTTIADEAVWLVNVDGAGLRRLTRLVGVDGGDARWSPTGERIAFACCRHYPNFPGEDVEHQLHLMTATGDGAVPLSSPPPRTSTVSVRRAIGGKLVTRFDVPGDVRDLGLSSSLVAVLVQESSGWRLEVRDARRSKLVRRVRVARTARDVSTAASTVVFRTGRTIRMLDARNGRVTAVTTTRSTPIGVSIEGKRIAWAETGGRNMALIRAVALGR